jgi:hypothetical protein
MLSAIYGAADVSDLETDNLEGKLRCWRSGVSVPFNERCCSMQEV